MMNLIQFVLLHLIVSVQSKITTKNKTLLIKEGDPFTLECDRASAKWELNGKNIAKCENCPSSTCNIDEAYKNRVTAFCKQEYSVLHFKSTQIGDKGSLQCPKSGSTNFLLLVGNYNITHFHSENKFPFALNQKNYTLVCDKEQNGEMIWYYETNNMLSYFNKDCSELISDYDKNKFHFTCDTKQKKGTFHIKQVSLSQDGNIIGCESAGHLYLFRLTVNVPVTSVSIQVQSQDLLENKDQIFVCKVEESKPEASFQWIIAYQNGSSQEIQQNSKISKTAKEKLWQTSSTLTLKLKRDYKKIMCKARIENMPWTNSKYQLLDIKYPPQGKPRIILSQSGICAGKSIEIKCEWKGGNPEATVKLSCLSEVKEEQSPVSIKKTVTQEMSRFCICKGMHIGKEDSVTEELDIQYPPNEVKISQTSYLEGETASLICEVSGGNPEVYNYTWSSGNYLPVNVIKIKLARALNKHPVTCHVRHKCKGGNPISSTIKLNVEYYPIIHTSDNMTVIENQTNKFSCLAEGNPKPTITWKIRNQIYKSKLLQVSFTRFNESEVQCIATANSSKHGILKSSKNISIFVEFAAHFKGDKLKYAMHKTTVTLKICFYCYPEATQVIWFKGNRIMPDYKVSYIPAEDGLFPFTGKCSILELYIRENGTQVYYLKVINPVGQRTFKLTLDSKTPLIIILASVFGAKFLTFVVVFSIVGIISAVSKRKEKCKKKCKKKTRSEVHEAVDKSEYDTIDDINLDSEKTTDYEIPYDDVKNTSINQSVKLDAESGYEKLDDIPTSSAKKDGNQPEYIKIIDNPTAKGQVDGNQPQYIEMKNCPPIKAKKDGNQPEYIKIIDNPTAKGKVDGNQPQCIEMKNCPPIKAKKDGNQPEYIKIIDNPTVNGHLDYEDLRN